MLAALGCASVEKLIDEVVPAGIRVDRTLELAARRGGGAGARRARALGCSQRAVAKLHRHGLAQLPHARRDPAQRAGEPRLVHRLYALPGRDLAGPAGGAPRLPADDDRPHRPAGGQCLASGRGDGRSRSDDADAPLERRRPQAFLLDQACHPQVIAVVRTRAKWAGIELEIGDPWSGLDPARVFGCHLQYPDTYGRIRDPRELIGRVHAAKGLVSMGVDLLALLLLAPPGELGADVAIGSAQRFGVQLGYGGPHAAFMACARRIQARHARPHHRRVAGRRRPDRRCAWRCRRASSTSGARRRRATSAPRRRCSPTSPRSTPSSTGPTASSASRCARISWRGCWFPH